MSLDQPKLITTIGGVQFKENRDFWTIGNPQIKRGSDWADDFGLYVITNPLFLQDRLVKVGITRVSFLRRMIGFVHCWGMVQPVMVLALSGIPDKAAITAREKRILKKFSAKDYQARVPYPLTENETEWIVLTEDSLKDLRAAFDSMNEVPSWDVWSGGLDSKRLDRLVESVPQPQYAWLMAPERVKTGWVVHWEDGSESRFTDRQMKAILSMQVKYLPPEIKSALRKRFGTGNVETKQDFLDLTPQEVAFEDPSITTDLYWLFISLVVDRLREKLC
jgi:hypothetical protein